MTAKSWAEVTAALADWVHTNVEPPKLAPTFAERRDILLDCAALTGELAKAAARYRPPSLKPASEAELRHLAQRCGRANAGQSPRIAKELVEAANRMAEGAPAVAAPLLLLGTKLGADTLGEGDRNNDPEPARRSAIIAYLDAPQERADRQAWLLARLHSISVGVARLAEAPRAARVAHRLSRLNNEQRRRLRDFRARLSDRPELLLGGDLEPLRREAEELQDDVMVSSIDLAGIHTKTKDGRLDWSTARDPLRAALELGQLVGAAAVLYAFATSRPDKTISEIDRASFMGAVREVQRLAPRSPGWRPAHAMARVSEMIFLVAMNERPERYCQLWSENDFTVLSAMAGIPHSTLPVRLLTIPCISTRSSQEATRSVDKLIADGKAFEEWARQNRLAATLSFGSVPEPGQFQFAAAYLASDHFKDIGHIDAARLYEQRAREIASQYGISIDSAPGVLNALGGVMSGETLFDSAGEKLVSDDVLNLFRAPTAPSSSDALSKYLTAATMQTFLGGGDGWRTMEDLLQSAEKSAPLDQWPPALRPIPKLLRGIAGFLRTGGAGEMRVVLTEAEAALDLFERDARSELALVLIQCTHVLRDHPRGMAAATSLARRLVSVKIGGGTALMDKMLELQLLLPKLLVIEADGNLRAAQELADRTLSDVNNILGSAIGAPSQIKAFQLWSLPVGAIADTVMELKIPPEQELSRRRLALRLADATLARSLRLRLRPPAPGEAASDAERRALQIERALMELELERAQRGAGDRLEASRARLMQELTALEGPPTEGRQALVPLVDADIDEVSGALGPRERLVLMHRLSGHVALFVLGPGRRIDMHIARTPPGFLDRVEQAAKHLSNVCSVVSEPRAADTSELLHELYRTLLRPLEDIGAIAPGDSLVVVSADELAGVPPALWIRQRDGRRARYIVEDYTMSRAPSVSVWLASARKWKNSAVHGRGHVFAVSSYSGAHVPFGPGGALIGVPSLPSAREEGLAVQRAIGRAVPEVAVALDGQATVQAFLSAARAKPLDVLHVAAHGLGGPTLRAPQGRSGLLLSGRGQDAFLPMTEILAERLTARTVVLSACDGGSGRGVSGEGALSLGWAMLASGAEAVVVSQWPLADRPVQRLMKGFYEAAAAGTSPAHALARVQRAFLDEPLPEAVACRALGDPITREQARRQVPRRPALAPTRWRDYPGMWGGLVVIGHDPTQWLVSGAAVKP